MAVADSSGQLIKVDPDVYIKCRLCVENTGRYQIMPVVQKQIHYCFDIKVDHFDGLPQLLCDTCKTLLDDYTAHKKKFVEKQENLLARLKLNTDNKVPPQQASTDNRSENEHEKLSDSESLKTETLNSATVKRRTIRNRLISDSSNESKQCTKTKKRRRSQVNKGWKKKYITYYVCHLCSNKYKKRKQLLLHLYNIHSNIKAKYHTILNKVWAVKLNKVDDKINETGNTTTVMFNHDEIIQITKNPMYHVLYVSQNKKATSDISLKESLKRICSESSDDDFYVNRKSARISKPLSRSSSNETVLIEGHKVTNVQTGKAEYVDIKKKKLCDTIANKDLLRNNDSECINIDDSSNSDMDLNTEKTRNANNKIECKTIDNIISVCKTKYRRKFESKLTIHSDSLLKHKILSIGTKVIKKDTKFNCTGILRYLEHRVLDIAWIPKRRAKIYSESVIRIMTRLKISRSNELNDNCGWTYLLDIENHTELRISNSNTSEISTVTTTTTTNISNNTPISQFLFPVPVGTYHGPYLAIQGINSCSVVRPENAAELETPKIILNETPVANPKPAPKKIPSNEVKLFDSKPVFLQVVDEKSENRPVFVQLVEESSDKPDPCMPVITSTTSLAPLKNKDTKKSDTTKEVEKTVPRIKVKPACELLKPTNIYAANDTWPGNSIENVHTLPLSDGVTGNIVASRNITIQQYQNVENPQPDSTHNNLGDQIILDTIEFPNTKTHSPFKYFKSLLGLHNINLLEPNAPMVSESICLLKIKVHFKQENKSKVVMLCLSIFCYDGVFCICIRDSNQVCIQMTKISANWQWEILKIFQGEVSYKILQNAEKAGPNIHSKTKTFINLLKSINCKSL